MSWRSTSIGHLVDAGAADIQTGPFGTQLKASDYVDDGTPVINVRNIGFGTLRPEKLEFVAEETAERLATHLLEPHDIVFGRKGAVDRHLYVGGEQDRWMQGSDCIRLRFIGTDVVPRFVSYAFLTETHQKWMLAQAGNKATMASLNHDIIRRITLRLPMPAVQEATVNILSAYDDLIENNRRRMALLEDAARQLYREWFVRLRFPGHEHTRITDGVPEGWERVPLGDRVALNYGKALKAEDRSEGPFPVYGSSGIVGTHDKAYAAAPGIVVGRKGNVGSVYWCSKDYWPIDTVYFVDAETSNLWLYYALQHMHFISTDVAVPGLNRDFAYSRPLLLPEPRVVRDFLDTAVPLHEQMARLDEMNEKLRAARDLLLPRLMTGEIAV
jgi:type I restriction enzyme S subunit